MTCGQDALAVPRPRPHRAPGRAGDAKRDSFTLGARAPPSTPHPRSPII
ncbi:hypothetical protein HMPREF1980_01136 [Actinomyces sp. oral taxon 172 str. F0311]|nr:hypothetical protein HMPREF1980_01136 [Actinomyces sp. oral taxon 172 str. F0311]